MSPFYQTHLQSQLNRADYLLLTLLVNLLQSIKQVKLETLATAYRYPLHLTVGAKSPKISITPAIDAGNNLVSNSQSWLKNEFEPQQVLYVAIDRTKWGCINLLMISLIWNRRALPILGTFTQTGSNFESQTAAITKIIRLFKDYKVVQRILFSQTRLLGSRTEVLLLTS